MCQQQCDTKSLRVVVADDEPEMLVYFRKMLAALGHEVIGTAEDGERLVETCRTLGPDLVISDIKMPGKDGVEAVMEVFRETPVRVILVTGYNAPEHIHHALEEMVLAYLGKPFKRPDLQSAIDRAEQRFQEFQALLQNAGDRKQAVEGRRLLKLAKGVLMKRNGLSDHAAFRRLQELAREKDLALVDYARTIIAGEQASWPLGRPGAIGRVANETECQGRLSESHLPNRPIMH